MTTSGGFGHLQKGHAVAFGDIDDTGVQDVVANIGGAMAGDKFVDARSSRTRATATTGSSSTWSARSANRFGRRRARAARASPTPRAARARSTRTVGSGGSFGASSLRPHVGLGEASAIESIEIRWPGSGETQRWSGPLAVDSRYLLHQGDPQVRLVESGRQGRSSSPPANP